MNTRIIRIDDPITDRDKLAEAAHLLRNGQIVAFPTETVYGLGADALNGAAVRRIFEAKGRPGDNPLIVHISEISQLYRLVCEIPGKADALMKAFWPGPLTLILKKKPLVPDEVTAGLDTVGVRMPSHPVARALINLADVPIAAPSANRSGRPSPTTARHVYDDMDGRIPLIIDSGSADVGVESTVVDMTGDIPVILRPGGITREMLEREVGTVLVDPSILSPLKEGQQVRSPGMKYKHYAPKAPVTIVRGDLENMASYIAEQAEALQRQGKRVGIIATDETFSRYTSGIVHSLGSRSRPAELAANLFSLLRVFDDTGVDMIFAESVDVHDEGLAVMNRMSRAAGFSIIDI